jgi:hypothetical protein
VATQKRLEANSTKEIDAEDMEQDTFGLVAEGDWKGDIVQRLQGVHAVNITKAECFNVKDDYMGVMPLKKGDRYTITVG